MIQYMIRCDMEGVSGVTSYDQVRPQSSEYAEARQWFMAELIALAEGLKEGGADRIVGDDTLVLSARTATEVWSTYWRIKLRCRAEME